MKIGKEKSFVVCVIISIAIIMCITLFSSCIATKKQRERYLSEHCTVSSKKEIKDTTTRKQTVKIDTSFINVPGPIQYLPSPCEKLCDSLGNLKPFKQESKKNGIKQSLESIGNVLVQKCDVDSLLQLNKELTIEIEHFRSEKTEVQIHENCKLDHLTEWDIFWIKVGKICSFAIGIYILLRILKVYLKTSVPWLSKLIP